MNKEISPSPAPFEETLPKYEKLLSEVTTGAQALLLLGVEPPDTSVLTLKKEELVKNATDGIPQDHKKRLTDASYNERDEYWKDIPVNERMEKWRQGFTAFLHKYTKDTTKLTEQAFLKAILKVDTINEVNADRLYNMFMLGEGKGDIEFFARRIVDTHTDKIEEIEKTRSLSKTSEPCTEITPPKSVSFSPVQLQTPDTTRTSLQPQRRKPEQEDVRGGCLDAACRELA